MRVTVMVLLFVGGCGGKNSDTVATLPDVSADGAIVDAGASDASSRSSQSSSDAGTGRPASLSTTCVLQPDGQPCGTGCGQGNTCAGYDANSLGCHAICDLTAPDCPCGRRCVAIGTTSSGAPSAACLPANGAGERCGKDPSGNNYGYGSCAQELTCVGPSADNRYCAYPCVTSHDCPAQTACTAVVSDGTSVSGTVCWYNSQPTGLPAGTACGLTDICISGTLCDGTCKSHCNGPGDASCAAGTKCTALMSGAQAIGYVCK